MPYLQEVDVRIVLDLPLEVSEFLEDLCESLGLLGQHGGVQEVDRVVGQARRGELLVLVRVVSPDLRKCGSRIKLSNLGWQPDVEFTQLLKALLRPFVLPLMIIANYCTNLSISNYSEEEDVRKLSGNIVYYSECKSDRWD